MGDSELSNYELTASRLSPRRTEVSTGDAEFVVGKDVNPVEYLLGSLVACLNLTGTMVARDMDIDIESLEATIQGDVNYATYRGEDVDDRAGLQGVEVSLSVETAGDADLDAWLSNVKDRCPVTDNVENETGVSVSID
ncbi:OsmC family protein [Halolamina rubra]|uniref:OsmC family protein n=1 Tax=Halolamina rubra TaxID=1380430 RepID=UPI000678AAF3|nr:OsmC family protein [Halolamina rubra]